MQAPPVHRALFDQAVHWAKAAGELSLRWFRNDQLAIDEKADGTPVTEADRAVERFLRATIASAYPNDAIVGEEEPDQRGTSTNKWILDPIDGTKAFTHGVPLYSNLLAYFDAHGPAIGIINLPALGETIAAGRGLGCFANGVRCHVSDTETIENAWICTSGLDNWPPSQLTTFASRTKLRTWGDAYGYALVATGRVDAMIDPEVAEYDIAAMLTILPEAGGRFTDLHGVATATGGSGVGSNGHLHAALLAQWAQL